MTADGVRGRYLNDLTRQQAQSWGSAWARRLWAAAPLQGRTSTSEIAVDDRPLVRGAPLVVVGYDERVSSPDLAVGVVTGLRQSGCEVRDIGRGTAAMWSFAVGHLGASGGLFVTGADCPASWTGFDFLGAGGQPLDPTGDLAALQQMAGEPPCRPTRAASSVRSLPILEDYIADVRRHFHALRPLQARCRTASHGMARVLERVVEKLPCQIQIEMPGGRPGDPASLAVTDRADDLTIEFAEDGQSLQLFDEHGQAVDAGAWQQWLLQLGRRAPLEHCTGTSLDAVDSTPSELWHAMRRTSAACGVDRFHRYWTGGPVPRRDALLTLAAILRAMSWSDAPLSRQLVETHATVSR